MAKHDIDDGSGPDSRPGIDRRRALLGMGAGAAAAWTAPAIFSQTAAAAASVCPGCGTTALDNGDAETGVLFPWGPFGTHPFGVSTWASLPAGITPVGGSGTYAFAATNTTDSTVEGYIGQAAAIDLTCNGLTFTLSGDLGGIAPADRIDLSIDVVFYDALLNDLGNGGAGPLTKTVQNQSTDNMLNQSSGGTVPTDAELIQVTVGWIGESASPLSATAVADNIALVIDCVV